MANFLNCTRVFPFSYGPRNDDSVVLKENRASEATLGFDLSVADCPEGCGFAFIFDDGCPYSSLNFSFESLEGCVDDLNLRVELKLLGNRIYDQYHICGRNQLLIDNVRKDTAEICIVCFRNGLTMGKKGTLGVSIR